MNRVKNFNATGVSPDGYLFAGDLNAIQDAAAALIDYAQNIGAATVQIGSSDLILLKFGSGEARLTGALRTDGILRGLSGLMAGAFTTSQRDTIPTGSAPYGIIILNTTTNEYEWNQGTDTSRSWTPLGGLVDGSVTTSKLASSVPIIPVGAALEWDYGAASIPSWSALQYGQALSRVTFATLNNLASVAGYPHGAGDGSTTFNIADKRGRVSAGKDDMGGAAANRLTAAVSGFNGATLGVAGGAEGVSLSTVTIPSHSHGVAGTPGLSDGTHQHSTNVSNTQGTGLSGSAGGVRGDSGQNYSSSFAASNLLLSAGSLSTSSVGSGGAHLNTQPTIIVNKIIRII